MFKTTTLVLTASTLALVAATSFASAGSIIAVRSVGSSQMHALPSERAINYATGIRGGGNGMLLPAVKPASDLKSAAKHRAHRGGSVNVHGGYNVQTHKSA
jgi:hypothetical protein